VSETGRGGPDAAQLPLHKTECQGTKNNTNKEAGQERSSSKKIHGTPQRDFPDAGRDKKQTNHNHKSFDRRDNLGRTLSETQ